MFDVIGYAEVSNSPTDTQYFWGDICDIAGKKLKILEINFRGDCLCITEKGLVDVTHVDIVNIDKF